MSHTSLILSALLTMAMLLFVAPNILAVNRGNILRNIALWLMIFLGLALIYQNFGPDSPHPMFNLPAGMTGMRVMRNSEEPVENRQPISPTNTPGTKNGGAHDSESKDDGEQGFTPPRE